MKKYIFSVLLGITLFAVSKAYSETPFEGVLEGYAEAPEVTNSATLYLKGNKARLVPRSMEGMPATNGLPLLDYDNMKLILIAEKDKYYLEMPLADMEKNLTADPLKLTSTGNKGTFLSITSEEFQGTDKETGVQIVALGTKDIVSKLNPVIAFQRISKDGLSISKAGRSLLDRGYFPVRIQASKSGKVFFYWEIRKIEKKAIDASKLEIPAGFVKFSEYMKKKNRMKSGR